MTTALLLATDGGERAAQALVPQAFHGPNVPTPVLTVPGAAALRDHALAFRPSLAPDGDPFRINLLWSKWGTLLTPGHAGRLHLPQPVRGGHGGHHPGEAAAAGVLPGAARRGGARPPGQPRDGRPDAGAAAPEPRRALPHRLLRRHRLRQERWPPCAWPTRRRCTGSSRPSCWTSARAGGNCSTRRAWRGTWRSASSRPAGCGRCAGTRCRSGATCCPRSSGAPFADIFGTIAQLGQKRQIHELREMLRLVYLRPACWWTTPSAGATRPGARCGPARRR